MVKVLILSHGSLAKGLYEACTMIVGKRPFLSYLGLGNQGLETFTQQINVYIKENMKEKILFLFDLKYGTPYNQVLIQLLKYKNLQYKLITGVNLPILLTITMKILNSKDEKIDLKKIVNESKNSIEVSENKGEQ